MSIDEFLDMPQPLSRVRPKAEIYDSSDVFQRRPELSRLISEVIGTWALIEAHLSVILTTVLGATATTVVAMLRPLKATSIQIDLIEAAGRSVLADPQLEMFEAIINIARRCSRKRNPIAHNVWGYYEELADAILLIEVEAIIEVMLAADKFRRELEEKKTTDLGFIMKNKPRISPERVSVYKEADFRLILAEMKKLSFFITSFHHFCHVGPGGDPTGDIRNSEPLLQEELLRVRSARQKKT